VQRQVIDEAIGKGWIEELTEIVKMINAIIRHRSSSDNVVRDPVSTYSPVQDPFVEHLTPNT